MVQISEKRFQYTAFCALCFFALCQLMTIVSYGRGVKILETYSNAPAFAFATLMILSGRLKRLDDKIGLAMVGWYVFTRIWMHELYLEHSWPFLINLLSTYCIALPYAGAAKKLDRQKGIRLVAWIYFVAAVLMAGIGICAVFMQCEIVIPYLGTRFGMDEYHRLMLGNHCNISGVLMLLGLLAGCWLLGEACTLRRLARFACPMLLLYMALSYTVCRIAMVQLAFFAVGTTVAMLITRKQRGWKTILMAAVAGILAGIIVFAGCRLVVKGTNWLLSNSVPQLSEVEKVSERSMMQNIGSLGYRIPVYRAVTKLLQDQPGIWFRGQLNSDMVSTLQRYVQAAHAHNSYLQILLNMGIVGLLVALWFTFRAIFTAFRVFFLYAYRSSMQEKLLAMIVITLLLSAPLESYLFSEYLTIYNLFFFLCLGYLIETDQKYPAVFH